jgi:hypothetical protein
MTPVYSACLGEGGRWIDVARQDRACREVLSLPIHSAHQTYFELDLGQMKELMRTPAIVDGRNVLDPQVCEKLDLVYRGIGQGVRQFAGKRRVAAKGIRVSWLLLARDRGLLARR